MNAVWENWSSELGLAASPLFGASAGLDAHYAMLDGVGGSFVFSDATAPHGYDRRALSLSADWTWSSMMRNHVLLEKDNVVVTGVDGRSPQPINRKSVEDDLEQFIRYLEQSSPRTDDVIDHVIGNFQSLRSLCPGAPEDQLTVFLALVGLRLDNLELPASQMVDVFDELGLIPGRYNLDVNALDRIEVDKDLIRRFFDELLAGQRRGRSLDIDLTIRHAGAELFQAAQLAPAPPPMQGQFFGLPSVRVSVRPHSLKGVAYTPIGLARALAEQAISVYPLAQNQDLVVADYACGSGSFLVETVAALSRIGWQGRLRLVGYDIAPTAVATTRFAIACAKKDYPKVRVDEHIYLADFLDPDLIPESADIVLMNPPYRSWPDMDKRMREQVISLLGSSYRNRPDLSTAFIERALQATKQGGILAALLPVGVVAGESAKPWRDRMSRESVPRLVAILGDHSLFRFATVNVAAVMLEKGADGNQPSDPGAQMVWASEVSGAASAALRQLRKTPGIPTQVRGDDDRPWTIYRLFPNELDLRANWLPSPMLLSAQDVDALRQIDTRIEDLFDVKTGIRAGLRDALVLSDEQIAGLDSSEKRGFQPIAEKQMISEGRVDSKSFFFSAGNDIRSEDELKSLFPTYYKCHLAAAKPTLEKRLRTSDRWWLASEARNSWRNSVEPRIVSRQWFKNDGFAVDVDGRYAVVQGYAWFPTKKLKDASVRCSGSDGLLEVLKLYCVLMSSDIFFNIAREYSTNSAGGQINLQQNLIRGIPMPNLPEVLSLRPELANMVTSWDGRFPALEDRNVFASICYGFGLASI